MPVLDILDSEGKVKQNTGAILLSTMFFPKQEDFQKREIFRIYLEGSSAVNQHKKQSEYVLASLDAKVSQVQQDREIGNIEAISQLFDFSNHFNEETPGEIYYKVGKDKIDEIINKSPISIEDEFEELNQLDDSIEYESDILAKMTNEEVLKYFEQIREKENEICSNEADEYVIKYPEPKICSESLIKSLSNLNTITCEINLIDLLKIQKGASLESLGETIRYYHCFVAANCLMYRLYNIENSKNERSEKFSSLNFWRFYFANFFVSLTESDILESKSKLISNKLGVSSKNLRNIIDEYFSVSHISSVFYYLENNSEFGFRNIRSIFRERRDYNIINRFNLNLEGKNHFHKENAKKKYEDEYTVLGVMKYYENEIKKHDVFHQKNESSKKKLESDKIWSIPDSIKPVEPIHLINQSDYNLDFFSEPVWAELQCKYTEKNGKEKGNPPPKRQKEKGNPPPQRQVE